jgi:hypothetical protein
MPGWRASNVLPATTLPAAFEKPMVVKDFVGARARTIRVVHYLRQSEPPKHDEIRKLIRNVWDGSFQAADFGLKVKKEPASSRGGNICLDIPFYRTFPILRAAGADCSWYGDLSTTMTPCKSPLPMSGIPVDSFRDGGKNTSRRESESGLRER